MRPAGPVRVEAFVEESYGGDSRSGEEAAQYLASVKVRGVKAA